MKEDRGELICRFVGIVKIRFYIFLFLIGFTIISFVIFFSFSLRTLNFILYFVIAGLIIAMLIVSSDGMKFNIGIYQNGIENRTRFSSEFYFKNDLKKISITKRQLNLSIDLNANNEEKIVHLNNKTAHKLIAVLKKYYPNILELT